MKAQRSKWLADALADPGFAKAFYAAMDAAKPKGTAPESAPGFFEFDYNGAHYRFARSPEELNSRTAIGKKS